MNKQIFILTCFFLAFNAVSNAQSCVYSELKYAIKDNGLVTFEEISEGNHLVRWDWQFGDGAIGSGRKVTHRYDISAFDSLACFDVVLTVNDGTNSGVGQPTKVCIPTSTLAGGNKLYIKIINPIEAYDGICNTKIAKIIAHQQTPFEARIFGGTPPYSCTWQFPEKTLPATEFYGQGPHSVSFPTVGNELCPTQLVRLDVTDANGLIDSSFLKISIRDISEIINYIRVESSKPVICANENISFKLNSDKIKFFNTNYNFLGVNPNAQYKWIIDGKEGNNNVHSDTINHVFTEGVHTVSLEIKEGNYVYKPFPKRIMVQSLATCNDTPAQIPPLEITGISNVPYDCKDKNLYWDLTGQITGGVPYELDKNNKPISKNKAYKSIKWRACYYNNPNREIIDFIKPLPNSQNLKAFVPINHAYFKNFEEGEQTGFVLEAAVTDWAGNEAHFITFSGNYSPLTILLPEEIYRCKSNDVALSEQNPVGGGKMPYHYEWQSKQNIFKEKPTTTTEIPKLNLTHPSVKLSNSITLKAKDADGCVVEKTVKVNLREIQPFSLDTAVQIACNNASSALTIGPINCNPVNLEATMGGSGKYSFQWHATPKSEEDNINDPFVPFLKVVGSSIPNSTVIYKLTISDYLGNCASQSASTTVKNMEAKIAVDLGADKVFCLSDALQINAKTTINDAPTTAGLTYNWTVDAADKIHPSDLPADSKRVYDVAPITEKNNQIVVRNLLPNLKYTYKVTVIDPISHCSATDEVVLESEKQWKYSGFESVIAPLLVGKKGLLWASANNHIFNEDTASNNSLKLVNKLPISPEILKVNYDKNGSINQGFFIPINELNTKIEVINNNGNGCKKEFISNTFYVIERNPTILLNANKKALFSGEDLCLNLILNTYILKGNKFLPALFKVNYYLKKGYLLNNKDWNITNFDLSGTIDFVLADANLGIYKANTCIKMPTVKDQNPYVFLINDGLPNFNITNDGHFKIDYQFDVLPTNEPLKIGNKIEKLQDLEQNKPIINAKIKESKGSFALHPSPFTDAITLDYEIKTEKGSRVHLSIYNSIGQLIDKIYDNRFHNSGVYSTTYNTDKLMTGLYFFELIIDEEKISKKSIKVD